MHAVIVNHSLFTLPKSHEAVIPVCFLYTLEESHCSATSLQNLGCFPRCFSSSQMSNGLGIGQSFSYPRGSVFIPFLN